MTYYWISAALVLVGIVVLVLVALRVYRALRTWNAMRGAVQTVIQGEVGLLRARRAALDVAMRRRGDEPGVE